MKFSKEVEELSKAEQDGLRIMSSRLEGINTDISDDVKECLKAYAARNAAKKAVGRETRPCLSKAYRLTARVMSSQADREAAFAELNIVPRSKPGRLDINAVVKATVTANRQYASKLTNVICLALSEAVDLNAFEDFVTKHGGIGKCIQEYAAMNVSEKVSGADDSNNKSGRVEIAFAKTKLKRSFLAKQAKVDESGENFVGAAILKLRQNKPPTVIKLQK